MSDFIANYIFCQKFFSFQLFSRIFHTKFLFWKSGNNNTIYRKTFTVCRRKSWGARPHTRSVESSFLLFCRPSDPSSRSEMMKAILALVVCLLVAVYAEQALEVHVEYLPQNCEIKSKKGDTIYWHYTGTLLDGTQFDSRYVYISILVEIEPMCLFNNPI